MVEIRYPPPTRNISPQWLELKPGTTIQRIFYPTSYGASAICEAVSFRAGFRYYDPLSRFDQQRSTKQAEVDSDRGIIYAGLNLSCCLIEVFGDDETILRQVQDLLGHADPRTTSIYAHVGDCEALSVGIAGNIILLVRWRKS